MPALQVLIVRHNRAPWLARFSSRHGCRQRSPSKRGRDSRRLTCYERRGRSRGVLLRALFECGRLAAEMGERFAGEMQRTGDQNLLGMRLSARVTTREIRENFRMNPKPGDLTAQFGWLGRAFVAD